MWVFYFRTIVIDKPKGVLRYSRKILLMGKTREIPYKQIRSVVVRECVDKDDASDYACYLVLRSEEWIRVRWESFPKPVEDVAYELAELTNLNVVKVKKYGTQFSGLG